MSRWNEFMRHVRKIPHGSVASYGQIAEAAGHGSALGRQVGYALAASKDSRHAWHRVLNRRGEIRVSDGERQRVRLDAEGVPFVDDRVAPSAFADAATLAGEGDLGVAIDRGDAERLRAQILEDPEAVERDVCWYFGQDLTTRPLHYVSDAVGNGWLEARRATALARVLLEHGAAIEGDPSCETPLIAACSHGAEDVAQLLIEEGARVRVAGVQGATALHRAARQGLPDAVSALIEAGAAVDARDTDFDGTPLHWAVHGNFHEPKFVRRAGRIEAMRRLRQAGASLEVRSRVGQHVLELADAEALDALE